MKYGKLRKPIVDKNDLLSLIKEAQASKYASVLALKKRALGTALVAAASQGRDRLYFLVGGTGRHFRLQKNQVERDLIEYLKQNGMIAKLGTKYGKDQGITVHLI